MPERRRYTARPTSAASATPATANHHHGNGAAWLSGSCWSEARFASLAFADDALPEALPAFSLAAFADFADFAPAVAAAELDEARARAVAVGAPAAPPPAMAWGETSSDARAPAPSGNCFARAAPCVPDLCFAAPFASDDFFAFAVPAPLALPPFPLLDEALDAASTAYAFSAPVSAE